MTLFFRRWLLPLFFDLRCFPPLSDFRWILGPVVFFSFRVFGRGDLCFTLLHRSPLNTPPQFRASAHTQCLTLLGRGNQINQQTKTTPHLVLRVCWRGDPFLKTCGNWRRPSLYLRHPCGRTRCGLLYFPIAFFSVKDERGHTKHTILRKQNTEKSKHQSLNPPPSLATPPTFHSVASPAPSMPSCWSHHAPAPSA